MVQPSDEEILERIAEKFFTRITVHPLKWNIENIGPNVEWKVPIGKIYEVYLFVEYGQVVELNPSAGPFSRILVENLSPWNGYFPAVISGHWAFDSTGGVATDERVFCTLPSGWILSGDEVLRSPTAWVVRWRDVTNIRGKGY